MPNLRVVALSVQLLAIGTVAGASRGETFNFPSERFDSIQAAIDVAVDGDEVVVAAGHHYQKIDFRGKRIRVRSSDGPLLTTIETPCWTSDHLVRAASGETRETVLEGFRVIEWCSDVPAIAITNSGLTVRNCAVQSNGHGAIQARGGYATALLENCHFSGSNRSIDRRMTDASPCNLLETVLHLWDKTSGLGLACPDHGQDVLGVLSTSSRFYNWCCGGRRIVFVKRTCRGCRGPSHRCFSCFCGCCGRSRSTCGC